MCIRDRIYQKAIEDFQALYPNIRVNLRLYTDYGKIYNDFITNISTNTTPNFCITYPDPVSYTHLDVYKRQIKYGLGSELSRHYEIEYEYEQAYAQHHLG